jgi:hypothetical protein
MAGFVDGSWLAHDTVTENHHYKVFDWKTLMKSAGWTVPSSGDGVSTYSASSDVITVRGTGAGGIYNSGAWFRLAKAGVELLVQTSASGNTWRIAYSPAAGFTGGSPGANNTPDAADQVFLLGGGTGASPSYAIWFGNSTLDVFAAGADQDDDSTAFWLAGWITADVGTVRGALFCDVMRDGYPVTDPDPRVLCCGTTGDFSDDMLGDCDGAVQYPKGFLGPVATASNFVGISALSYRKRDTDQRALPYRLADGPFHSGTLYDTAPIFYARNSDESSPYGAKGWSKTFLWCNTPNAAMTRNIMGSSPGEARDWMRVGALWVPWSGEDTGESEYDLFVWADDIGVASAPSVPYVPTPSALPGTNGGIAFPLRTTAARNIA